MVFLSLLLLRAFHHTVVPPQIISTLLLISWWCCLPSAKLILEILSHPAHSIFYPGKEDLTLQFLVKQRGRPFVSYHYIYYVQSAEGGRRSEQEQRLLQFPSNVNCFSLTAAKPSSLLNIKRSCHFCAVLETLMRTWKVNMCSYSEIRVSSGCSIKMNLKETFPTTLKRSPWGWACHLLTQSRPSLAGLSLEKQLLRQCKSDSSLLTGAARLAMHTRWALPGASKGMAREHILGKLSCCDCSPLAGWHCLPTPPTESRKANLWAHLQQRLTSTQGGLEEAELCALYFPWRKMGSCASKRWGHSSLAHIGHRLLCNVGYNIWHNRLSFSALLQLREELLPFCPRWLLTKVLLCLLGEQTYEVSQVFTWCFSFLPWKVAILYLFALHRNK